MGDNNYSTLLRSVETEAISPDASSATSIEQHEPDVHRVADGSEISVGSLAAFEKHFSSLEGKLDVMHNKERISIS